MDYNLMENGTTITRIDVSFGKIKTLPILPLHLEILVADNNFRLEEIPKLPMSLRVLSICLTSVQCLSGLPPTLEELYVSENPGIQLPAVLPQNLQILVADCCELEVLPVLPSCLTTLSVDGNHLEKLPELPSTIQTIIASNNQLLQVSQTPELSKLRGLSVLYIHNNVLRRLPELPPTLLELNCSENNLKRLPVLPASLQVFVFFGNPLVYEILHKRIRSHEYINRINHFSRFMATEVIRKNVFSWIQQKHAMESVAVGGGGGGTWDSYSKNSSSFSSISSFCSISSSHLIDYPPPPATSTPTAMSTPEDEFVFL
jgi:hypothetical protein